MSIKSCPCSQKNVSSDQTSCRQEAMWHEDRGGGIDGEPVGILPQIVGVTRHEPGSGKCLVLTPSRSLSVRLQAVLIRLSSLLPALRHWVRSPSYAAKLGTGTLFKPARPRLERTYKARQHLPAGAVAETTPRGVGGMRDKYVLLPEYCCYEGLQLNHRSFYTTLWVSAEEEESFREIQ